RRGGRSAVLRRRRVRPDRRPAPEPAGRPGDGAAARHRLGYRGGVLLGDVRRGTGAGAGGVHPARTAAWRPGRRGPRRATGRGGGGGGGVRTGRFVAARCERRPTTSGALAVTPPTTKALSHPLRRVARLCAVSLI